MRAFIDKKSYVPGERINIHYELDGGDLTFAQVSNISTDIFHLGISRNEMLIGFGATPKQSGVRLTVSVNLPVNSKIGICLLERAVFQSSDAEGQALEQKVLRFEPVFFDIRPHFATPTPAESIATSVMALSQQREVFSNRLHLTDKAKVGDAVTQEFTVMIFAVGCLLHTTQQLEGYSVSPTRLGLSLEPLLEVMNARLTKEGIAPLSVRAEMKDRFAKETPTLEVKFSRVLAISHEDAFEYCRSHSRQIFDILGRKQGQIPREFGGVAFEIGSTRQWYFIEMPGYRGNLISDFDPSSLAKSIETTLLKLQQDPFARLLTRVFADATGEMDDGIRYLRYWTVLELAADRSIKKDGTTLLQPNGHPILKLNGRPETTNTKVGRVYQYILKNFEFSSAHNLSGLAQKRRVVIIGDKSNPNYTEGAEVYSLWQMVSAAYAVRNSVAHEGYFDAKAAKNGNPNEQLAAYLSEPPFLLQDFLRSLAERVVNREA